MQDGKLIRRYETVAADTFEDLLLIYATNVENALIQAGAEPGRDYTILDCFKLAEPYFLHVFKENRDLSIFLSDPPRRD